MESRVGSGLGDEHRSMFEHELRNGWEVGWDGAAPVRGGMRGRGGPRPGCRPGTIAPEEGVGYSANPGARVGLPLASGVKGRRGSSSGSVEHARGEMAPGGLEWGKEEPRSGVVIADFGPRPWIPDCNAA